MKGTIKIITSDQMYGTLIGEDGTERLFHRPESSLIELLSEGDAVLFTPTRTDKGPGATAIHLQPCPYCEKPIHTAGHMSKCPDRPQREAPPLHSVKLVPAVIGNAIVHFIPNVTQPQRNRFHIYSFSGGLIGKVDRYDAAVEIALKEP
jgi:cold shock CspA family protein